MSKITKDSQGRKYHELHIANQIITKDHECLLVVGRLMDVAQQIIALRYLKDKYDCSVGDTWMDTYTERFGGIVDSVTSANAQIEALKNELEGLERDILPRIELKKK